MKARLSSSTIALILAPTIRQSVTLLSSNLPFLAQSKKSNNGSVNEHPTQRAAHLASARQRCYQSDIFYRPSFSRTGSPLQVECRDQAERSTSSSSAASASFSIVGRLQGCSIQKQICQAPTGFLGQWSRFEFHPFATRHTV